MPATDDKSERNSRKHKCCLHVIWICLHRRYLADAAAPTQANALVQSRKEVKRKVIRPNRVNIEDMKTIGARKRTDPCTWNVKLCGGQKEKMWVEDVGFGRSRNCAVVWRKFADKTGGTGLNPDTTDHELTLLVRALEM
ncbi:hypothetical protein BT69DRAFT_1315009 [Atractiella rhizophila]|nr:hypothetical protein BT69DRAFT_1315009 [Atractiella rhizophila]